MRPATEGVLVDTDVLVDFLTTSGTTILQRALVMVPCYTTVIHAAELFGAADGEEEVRIVRAALSGLRVLGISSRYAFTMGTVAREARKMGTPMSERDALMIGAAIEARLPVLTRANADRYRAIPGMSVLTPEELERLA